MAPNPKPQTLEQALQVLRELEVQKIDLELHEYDLRSAQHALEASRSRYADLFDLAPVGYCLLDLAARITSSNLTLAMSLGVERSTLEGSLFPTYLHDDSKATFRAHLKRCTGQRLRASDELRFAPPRLEPTLLRMVSTPLFDGDGHVCGAKSALLDLSEDDRSRERQRLQAEVNGALGPSLVGGDAPARLAEFLVSNHCDVCYVDLVRGDRLEQRQLAFAARGDLPRTAEVPSPSSGESPQALALRSGAPVSIEPPQRMPAGSFEASVKIKNLLCIPLVAEGRRLGVVSLGSFDPARRYGQRERILVQEIARRAALSLDSVERQRATERAVHVREDILGAVSHDLRSPLNNITLALGWLRSATDPEACRAARIIERAAQRMSRMIGDLLDFSSLEAGHLAVNAEVLECEELLRDATDALTASAAAKRIRLEIGDCEPATLVVCDRERVLQVFSNLVDNAVKFTPEEGVIEIAVAILDDHQVLFSVRDSGPGISEEARHRLFDRYWQADANAKKGRGLGLYITRGIIEAMGGTIWIDSKLGQGSTFYFSLPRAAAAPDSTTRPARHLGSQP